MTKLIITDEFVITKKEDFFEFVTIMGQFRDEVLLKKVVEKIKKLRDQHGITQEKFYNDTNINIARIESSKANVSISTLNAICKYFNLSLSEFLKGM